MKQILLLGLLLLATIRVAGQTQNVDSLVNVLDTKKLTVDERISTYNDICYYYLNSDPKKAMLYAQDALSFAEKENKKKWIAGFNATIGSIHLREGDYNKALDFYNKALNLVIAEKTDPALAYIYGSIASLYGSQGKYATAIDYYLKSLSIYEQGNTVKHKRQQLVMLTNIGTIHRSMDNPDLAIQYYDKAEKLIDELNYPEGKIQIYYDLGDIYSGKKEYQKALDYALKSLELSRTYGEKRFECANLGTLSMIYNTGYNDYAKAEEYANEYLKLAKELNYPQVLIGAWHTLATVYLAQNRYAESEKADLIALNTDSVINHMSVFINYNLGIANIYLGNKENAIKYLEKSSEIDKNLANENSKNIVLDMETKYETEKKEAHIASLEKERRLYNWLGIAGGLLVISMGIVLWLYVRNTKKERQLIATKALQDGELSERTRIAEDIHDRLGGSLSAVKIELRNAESLQNVSDKLDECIKEVREITHNLMPRSLRLFGMKGGLEDFAAQFPNVHFHFYGKEKRINDRMEFAVYCCASELITNSLRYSGAENINAQLVQDEKYVSLTVQDDGCGFDEKEIKPGIGLKNIRDRVASYNGKLDIASSPGNGTETTIELRVES